MSSIKDRNGMDLTEAEDIKKRWQEYTEELYKKKKSYSIGWWIPIAYAHRSRAADIQKPTQARLWD